MPASVGFIGLGRMGLPMAHNLLAAHARGRGDLDWGALITVIRELAGLEPGDSSSSEPD